MLLALKTKVDKLEFWSIVTSQMKRIYEHTAHGLTGRNGFIVGDYDHSFNAFRKLAAQAKKDFRHLKDDDIKCKIVTESSIHQGCAYVRFSLMENSRHPDYKILTSPPDFY